MRSILFMQLCDILPVGLLVNLTFVTYSSQFKKQNLNTQEIRGAILSILCVRSKLDQLYLNKTF